MRPHLYALPWPDIMNFTLEFESGVRDSCKSNWSQLIEVSRFYTDTSVFSAIESHPAPLEAQAALQPGMDCRPGEKEAPARLFLVKHPKAAHLASRPSLLAKIPKPPLGFVYSEKPSGGLTVDTADRFPSSLCA